MQNIDLGGSKCALSVSECEDMVVATHRHIPGVGEDLLGSLPGGAGPLGMTAHSPASGSQQLVLGSHPGLPALLPGIISVP